MKKFKFRLQKVLQFRESIKEEKLRELQKASLALVEAQNHLEFLEQEFIKGQISENETLLVSEVYIRSSYCERLKREVESQRIEIQKRQEQVELARNEYFEATKECEALLKVKENKHQDYLSYVAKEEEKFLDELVTQRVARQILES
jgi:flagellar FliJ protein